VATKQEVEQVIREVFPEARPRLEQKLGRINGIIVWDGFKNMEIRERNTEVTRRVRNKLSLNGMNVGILYPLAPRERL